MDKTCFYLLGEADSKMFTSMDCLGFYLNSTIYEVFDLGQIIYLLFTSLSFTVLTSVVVVRIELVSTKHLVTSVPDGVYPSIGGKFHFFLNEF